MKFLLMTLALAVWTELSVAEEEEVECDTLRDFNTQCGGWFQLGYCKPDSSFHAQARKLCPSSCGGCGLQFEEEDDCLVLEDTMPQCHKWKLAGKCSYLGRHYGYMMKHCPFSCNDCVPELYAESEECAGMSDYDPSCRILAEQGFCQRESHAQFMAEHCTYSCNGCLKPICAVAQDVSDVCAEYKARGWCARNHFYHRDIINDCQATCNDCN